MDQHIKDWCIAECKRQHATALGDFYGMFQAWRYANATFNVYGFPLHIKHIVTMAEMIDPVANPGGRFRTGPAVFMDGGTAASAHSIGFFLSNVIEDYDNGHLSPTDFYQELMWIHPFKDGNGRVGALVYNILNGTIDNPVNPPPYK